VDRAKEQSGEDQKRLDLPDVYTAIWWYARFPNHYGGDGSTGNRELGEAVLKQQVDALVAMIKTVKNDSKVLELQKKFFDQAEKPLATPQ
jgi:creatinine amidohydrolase